MIRGSQVVYSGGVDVDLLAEGAGKGLALQYVLGRLRAAGAYPTQGVQVNGDSGNDAELLDVPGVKVGAREGLLLLRDQSVTGHMGAVK